MRKFAVTLLGATMLAGAATSATAQTRGVTEDEIILGTHTAMSGPVAPWGTGSVNGMTMRFNEANEAGGVHGRQIRLVVEDTGYQVPRAVQAANKLLNRDQIFAMIGALGTPMNNAVMQRQLAANVINFAPFSGARSMGEPFHRLKFVGLSTYYDQTRAGVNYFTTERGRTKVCSIYQDSDFGREILEGTQDQLAAQNMEMVLAIGHRPTETEFTGTITRLREAGCDLVTMGTIIRDAIIPYQTARGMGWTDVDFVTSVASYDLIVGQRAGDGLYSVTSFQLIYPDSDQFSEAQRQWAAEYQEQFGTQHNQASQLGYIYADVFVTALERAGPQLTVNGMVIALESIHNHVTRIGNAPITFGPDDHVGADQSFLAVTENGQWKQIAGPFGAGGE